MKRERLNYDIVVVGGGHNGLVAAAYLAKAGLRVIILERRDMVGGASITEEIYPGCKANTLAYTVGLLSSRVIEELNLREVGYTAYPYDPQFFMPFPDGRYLFIWRDDRKTIEEIKRFSEKDAEKYPEFIKTLQLIYEIIKSMLEGPPPSITVLASYLEDPTLGDVMKMLVFGSAKDFLDEFFESEEVKALFATQSVIGSFMGPMSMGSAYIMLHHALTEINGELGVWGYVKGGMGAVSDCIARAAKKYGADILTGINVRRIIVREGEVKGVETDDGRIIESRIVVSTVDPKTTFLKLVGEENLEEEFVRRVKRIKTYGCAMKVNCVLKELPDFKAYPGRHIGPQHRGTIDIAPSIEYLEKAFDEAKYGMPSRNPFLEMTIQSAVDKTVAPPGLHVLSIFSQYAPYELRKGSWDEVKEDVADNVVEKLVEYASNVKSALVYRKTISPLDMERIYGLPKGDIFHVAMTPDQLLSMRYLPGWSNYTTPIKNLFLGGAGTHPGGGVIGLPGRNVAMKVVEELEGRPSVNTAKK